MADPPVHILFAGGALCGKAGVPGDWGDDHRWVAYGAHAKATCRDCLIEARIADAISEGLGQGQREALLRLLRRAVAWRAQGSITRWKTAPSRALALEVDKLFETLPALVAGVAPEGWAEHQAAFGEAEEHPALPAPVGIAIDGGIIQRGRYIDAEGVERTLDMETEPTLTLSQWSLAVGSRWGRVLYFADLCAHMTGVLVERVDLTDKAATLHLRLGECAATHVVDWALLETGFEEGWRGAIAAAIHQLQKAQPPGA